MFGLWTRAKDDIAPPPDALSVPQLVELLVQPAVKQFSREVVGSVIPVVGLLCLVIGLIAGLMGGLIAAAVAS